MVFLCAGYAGDGVTCQGCPLTATIVSSSFTNNRVGRGQNASIFSAVSVPQLSAGGRFLCLPASGGITFSWSAVAGGQPVPLSAAANRASTPTLVLPAGTLQANTQATAQIVACYTAALADTSLCGVAQRTFDVVNSPLVVLLAGGNATVGQEPFTLDASASYDPDGGPITFSWGCSTFPGGGSCGAGAQFDSSPKQTITLLVRGSGGLRRLSNCESVALCLVNVGQPPRFLPRRLASCGSWKVANESASSPACCASNSLQPPQGGVTSVITLTVTSTVDGRTATASTRITARASPQLPVVSIRGLPGGRTVNPSAKLTVFGSVRSFATDGSLITLWTVVEEPGNPPLNLSSPSVLATPAANSGSIVFQPNALRPRSRYVFQLSATDSAGSTSAQVEVLTSGQPRASAATGAPGRVTVTPATGVGLQTSFRVSTTGWLQNEDPPLSYQVAYVVNGSSGDSGACPLSLHSSSSVRLPPL